MLGDRGGSGEDAPPVVYLIHEKRDGGATEPVEDLLFDLGCEVCVSSFEGDEAEMGRVHRKLLTTCDAAVVYYGAGTRAWVEMKLMDIMQSPGWGRNSPLLAKAVLLGPPDDRHKSRFRTRLAEVIKPAGDAPQAADLEPLVRKLLPQEPRP